MADIANPHLYIHCTYTSNMASYVPKVYNTMQKLHTHASTFVTFWYTTLNCGFLTENKRRHVSCIIF